MKANTLSRVILIKKIATHSTATSQQASQVLEKTLEEIGKALASGEDVKISSFGTFGIIYKKKERVGRNPRTGKDAKISPRRVISFRASRDFRRLVMNLSN
jgi:integration host factor subunit alpha